MSTQINMSAARLLLADVEVTTSVDDLYVTVSKATISVQVPLSLGSLALRQAVVAAFCTRLTGLAENGAWGFRGTYLGCPVDVYTPSDEDPS